MVRARFSRPFGRCQYNATHGIVLTPFLFLATKALLFIPSSPKSLTPLQHCLLHHLLHCCQLRNPKQLHRRPPLPSSFLALSLLSTLHILLFLRGARLLLTAALILPALDSPTSSSSSSSALHQIRPMAAMGIRKDSALIPPHQLLIGRNCHHVFSRAPRITAIECPLR